MTAARNRSWFPESAFFAIWSSSAFLFYLGTLVSLGSILGLLGSLDGPGSDAGLVGWATLALTATAGAAALLFRAGRPILAGLAAFVGLILFAVWVGAIFDWIGFIPDDSESFFQTTFEPSLLVLEALVVAAGLWAVRTFRFPLLMLPVAVIAWYGLVDNLSLLAGDPGDDAHAVLALIVGALLVAVGAWLDRSGRAPYAFWLHVVGSLTAGAGIVELLGSGDWAWALAGLISLCYVALAAWLLRSSYAVIGALGVLVVGTYFIQKWYPFISVPFLFEGDPSDDPGWKAPLGFLGLGVFVVVLGVLVEWGSRVRRQALPAHSP